MPGAVDVFAEGRGGVLHVPVHGEVHQVFALRVLELAVDKPQLYSGLFDALREITLVERETKLPIFEDVVGPRLIIAASRAFHWWPGSKDVASLSSIPPRISKVQRGLHLGGEEDSFSPLRVVSDGAPGVLVVEDDERTAAFLADNLRADGFRVATASEAGEAVRAIEVRRPDLVVLDLALGTASGLAVLDRVRS